MKTIAVDAETGSLHLREKPKPTLGAREALVRTRHVGIDETDHEILAGSRGGFPEGDDHLVLGHEAVGEVVDTNDAPQLSEGDIVVPTVRRRPDRNEPLTVFTREELDMEPIDAARERGILGEHGFMAEYFTSHAEHLVTIPTDLAECGFLVEPVSNIEKALEVVYSSRLHFDWDADTALVLGSGPLGSLAVARLSNDPFFEDVYCYGDDENDRGRIEGLGATYVTTDELPYAEYTDAHPAPDLVIESTGNPPHPFETLNILAPNGVCASLGVPSGESQHDIDLGTLQAELILNNKALVGSANSRRHHFERAVDSLQQFPDWFLAEHTDGLHAVDEYEVAFFDADDSLKTGVTFTE